MRLCTVCARGGSKGVPGKNVRLVAGRPLIAHTIAQALETGLFDRVAVSSDSDAILEAATAAGAHMVIKRPAEMATDQAGKVPAIAHALRSVEEATGRRYDLLVDLDCTSPLRFASDIVDSVRLQEETDAESVITGNPAHRSPYFNLVERSAEGIASLSKPLPDAVLRRQDSPACFDMNGSVYVWKRDSLLNDPRIFYPSTRIHVMPRERSWDIDEELDFTIVEMLLERRRAEAAR